jgi:hypothetical protein
MPRRLIVILIIAVFFLFVAALLLKPAITIIAKKQLGDIFKQGRVSIGRCAIKLTRQLNLFDIEIKRQGFYEIKVKEAAIRYNLFSIHKPASRKLFLKSATVYINAPKRRIGDFFSSLNLKPGEPVLGAAEISDLTLDLHMRDIAAKAIFSSELNLIKQWPRFLDIKIDFLNMFGLELEDAVLKAGPGPAAGNFSISRLKYDKLGIIDIKGAVKLEDKEVTLSGISAQALGGNIEGDLELRIENETQYAAHIKCIALDIASLIRDFDWQERFEMRGRLSGELKLKGSGAQLEILEGNFSALAPGGELVIKDAKFLDDMAKNAQKPLDLLVESFKNYSYNTGMAVAGFQDGDIVLKVDLEGQAGKRNLNVILHDFKLGNIE